jgi:thiol-disulfide isomerase/thioredoxin
MVGAGSTQVALGITQISVADRQAMPALSGSTLQGASYTAAHKGHVTVVNMWGAWCSNCRVEAASLAETYDEYRAKGVQFLGIDTQDDNAAALAYVSQFSVHYPSLQDPDETLSLAIGGIVPVDDVPSTLIVDSSGRVAVRALGSITEPELTAELGYVRSGG